MAEQKQFTTALASVNNAFLPMIERQLTGNGIKMDDYAKQCVVSAISAIHTVLDNQGIAWNNPQLDNSNVTQALLSVASLKLNAAASPREVYFQVRNVKKKDKDGKECWSKKVEMGIEGDGNDSILARFGRDVKKVGQFWMVRENDNFEYPKYNGLAFDPPKWTPSGKGDVVKVVYPIIKNDNTIEFYIGERDDVARNLLAHINSNLMNETFGICVDRFKATPDQKKQIAIKKAEVLKKAKNLGLESLDDAELQSWISPAWTEYHSREQMIIRKMRNNIVKKIPKDFGNAFVEMTYSEQSDDTLKSVNQEIKENANSVVIDIKSEPVSNKPEPAAEEVQDQPEPEQTPEAEPAQEGPVPPANGGGPEF